MDYEVYLARRRAKERAERNDRCLMYSGEMTAREFYGKWYPDRVNPVPYTLAEWLRAKRGELIAGVPSWYCCPSYCQYWAAEKKGG